MGVHRPSGRAARRGGPRARASSVDSMASHRIGLPSSADRTAARRSASVLPTPSKVTRELGTPARAATAHSPRETTFASKPRSTTSRTMPATSFALTENARSHGSGKAARTASQAASRVARSVTATGVP
jgi:hypothetical protein